LVAARGRAALPRFLTPFPSEWKLSCLFKTAQLISTEVWKSLFKNRRTIPATV
jgi:hypothetical protein